MPFSLGDLKRSYGRSGSRGGAPDVRPYLLTGAELEKMQPVLDAAIKWFESHAGDARHAVAMDDLAQIAGDYRLARCLASCLHTCFSFRTAPFEDTVHETFVSAAQARAAWHRMQEVGAGSASDLRLHVFDAVNREHGGFVAATERDALMGGVSSALGCTPEQIERLLWSDAEAAQRLTQVAPAPSAAALAAQYNRRALETLLCRALSADLLLASPDGAAIRRLYLAVKRAGLLCELELKDSAAGPGAGVWAHLFGPLEVFGPRTRHGDRFARAVIELLRAFPGLQGEARVLVNEREYVLRLARGLSAAVVRPLAAMEEVGDIIGEALPDQDQAAIAVVKRQDDDARFDSATERQLYETLRGMERRGDTRGWRVEREPEPIIHAATVMVPDFGLRRTRTQGEDERHVFVEVIGFWTQSYRERKRAKLLALGGAVDLVLVVDEQLAKDFEGLPYSILSYKRRPSAVDLITLLEHEYGGSALRDTLQPAVRAVVADEQSMASLKALCERHVLTGSPISLDRVRELVSDSGVENARAAAEHLEALLPRLGMEAVWESLFEATVRRTTNRDG